MHIPKHFHGHRIHQYGMVPSELPQQPLDSHRSLSIDANYKARIGQAERVAFDHQIMNSTVVSKPRLGCKHTLAENMLLPGHQNGTRRNMICTGSLTCFFPHVPKKQHRLLVGNDDNVKPFNWFGTGSEPSPRKVPMYIDFTRKWF
ncbi:hypothetical protein F3Y22_tig00116959pilonHSYRG00061 [Hibiscus syriacus]|uniref:Uncharacterized protein n=1 Tax=Hibiscus syriacus TaxID=106335 RepID=A0A6A2WX23_HIBSY|nr:hypothetical protein F3Y22_tig00116959pilonHSYRG00061 [Hibiscus syriacus]